jgi:hypothetical protein
VVGATCGVARSTTGVVTPALLVTVTLESQKCSVERRAGQAGHVSKGPGPINMAVPLETKQLEWWVEGAEP